MAKNIPQVERLVGKPCWAVVGKAFGEIQSFQGEYCVFVEGCAWRIQDGETIVGGWTESEEEIETITQKLVGCVVTRVVSETNTLDLLIEFSGRYILYLFCDRTVPDDLTNYSIHAPEGWCIVKPRSVVEFEKSAIRGQA